MWWGYVMAADDSKYMVVDDGDEAAIRANATAKAVAGVNLDGIVGLEKCPYIDQKTFALTKDGDRLVEIPYHKDIAAYQGLLTAGGATLLTRDAAQKILAADTTVTDVQADAKETP